VSDMTNGYLLHTFPVFNIIELPAQSNTSRKILYNDNTHYFTSLHN